MHNFTKFLAFCILAFFVFSCNSSGSDYSFKISDEDGPVIISGSFSGSDMNKDGIIDKSELKSFTEECPLDFEFSMQAGWKKSFTPETLPKITHGIVDLQSFQFDLKLWKQGKQALRFKTNTKDSKIASGYHFWRQCEFLENSSGIDIISGVGDGTQGLEMSMRTLENPQIEVTK